MESYPSETNFKIQGSYLLSTLGSGFVSIFRFGKQRKPIAIQAKVENDAEKKETDLSKLEKNVDSIHGFQFGSLVWARSATNQSFYPGKVLASAELTNKDVKHAQLPAGAKTDVVKLLIQFFRFFFD